MRRRTIFQVLSLAIVGVVLPVITAAPARALCPQDSSSCTSPTSCTFQGFENHALGAAQLAIVAGQLRVSNIGGSGNDGVEVINSGLLMFGDTADWDELGYGAWLPVDLATTDPGDFMQFQSYATLSPGGASQFLLRFTQINGGPAPNAIQIAPTYPTTGTVSVKYEAFNASGVLVAGPSFSMSAATASDWPDSQNFSAVRWVHDVTVTLPNGNTANNVRSLEILPQSGATILAVGKMEVTLKGTAVPFEESLLGSGLTSLTVTAEGFPDPPATACFPAFSTTGRAAVVLLLLAAVCWRIYRAPVLG